MGQGRHSNVGQGQATAGKSNPNFQNTFTINKQNSNRLIDTESTIMVARGVGGWGRLGKRSEG